MTPASSSNFVRAAHDAGALGYVLKQQMTTDLPEAINRASAGERAIYFSIRS
jgi:DNA-binding NarL/FixJ family response regulator